MDDLSARLSEILSDEKSMQQVKKLADSLLAGKEGDGGKREEESGGFGVSGEELNRIMSVFARLKTKEDDRRTALIAALRPNLSPQKQKKADTAIKLLKLIDMLPLLKDSGILDLF